MSPGAQGAAMAPIEAVFIDDGDVMNDNARRGPSGSVVDARDGVGHTESLCSIRSCSEEEYDGSYLLRRSISFPSRQVFHHNDGQSQDVQCDSPHPQSTLTRLLDVYLVLHLLFLC